MNQSKYITITNDEKIKKKYVFYRKDLINFPKTDQENLKKNLEKKIQEKKLGDIYFAGFETSNELEKTNYGIKDCKTKNDQTIFLITKQIWEELNKK